MSRIQTIQKPDDCNGVAACFIHGVGSSTEHAWRHSNGTFFPELLAEDFPKSTILTVDYEAPRTKYSGISMALRDYGMNLLDLIGLEDSEDVRSYVYFCHSMGGLVLKQALRIASDSSDTSLNRIAEKASGIFFLSTPHYGSDVAHLASILEAVFRPTKATEDLKRDNDTLIDLHTWFRQKWGTRTQGLRCFGESVPTNGIMVVPPSSWGLGMDGVRDVPLTLDHAGVSKPDSKDAQVYKHAVKVMRACCDTVKETQGVSASGTFETSKFNAPDGERSTGKEQEPQTTMKLTVVFDREYSPEEIRHLRNLILSELPLDSSIQMDFFRGSIVVEIRTTPEHTRRIMKAIRNGRLDHVNVISARSEAEEGEADAVKTFAVREKYRPPQTIPNPRRGAAVTLICPRKHILGMESYIDAVERFLPAETDDLSESVFFLSNARVWSKNLSPSEVIFFQTNFVAPGQQSPSKLITNETNSLLVLLANLVPPGQSVPRYELQRYHAMIDGFHKNRLRYLVHSSLFVHDLHSYLNLDGATKWLKVSEPELPYEFELGSG